jgi:hypothetical protein
VSYAAIAVDFILRDLSFLEEIDREKILKDGFLYGARGRAGTKNLIDASINLVQQFTDRGAAIATEIRTGVEAQIASLPANILSQFFSRAETGRVQFEVAKELEALGMARAFRGHTSASTGARSLIGCLLDFWSIDRRAFSLESHNPNQGELQITTAPGRSP